MKLDLDNSRPPTRGGEPWGTTARVIAGLGGMTLLGLGAQRRGWAGVGLGLVGVALLGRSASGAPTARLVASGGDPYAFEARREITVGRPVAEVFALLSDYANYPDFMPSVREMQVLPGLRHRWTLVVPGGLGVPVRDAITQLVPDEFVAWESEPESTLAYAGAARFRSVGSGTLVEARMSYGPPLGAVGDACARLLGQDPGQQLGEIFGRARDYLESGRFQPALV